MKERSRISKLIACVAVLVGVFGITVMQAAVGKAVVRSIKGEAQYSVSGAWLPLKAGQELDPGAVIRTANDSEVILNLKENGPHVKLLENTTLGIDKLTFEPTGADTVIETQLDLKAGQVVGVVRKLSPASKYEVKTPNGVAGIRGTEYAIAATGQVYVSKGSVVVVAVFADGTVDTQVVNAGQMYDPATRKVIAIPAEELNKILRHIADLIIGEEAVVPVEGDLKIYVTPLTGSEND